MTHPQISIVMPSYNQASFIDEAVRSVLNQAGVEVELLVLDPGSTDGSRELLQLLRQEYGERLRLFFEPDSGQSDAVNRGMALARGRVLGWLNSDDRLAPGALARVAPLLDLDRPAWLYGDVGMIDGSGASISSFIVGYKRWRSRRFSLLKLLTENFISQMGVFWNRPMWDRAGGLDLAKDLDMDYDLWLRFAAVAEPAVLQERLADFRVHGAAKGSLRTSEQLAAACTTARSHAVGHGMPGRLALLLHMLLSLRTRIIYRFMKPNIRE
ncbi:MAG TPA: glycosyltransferase family 2 protein [Geobacteraceae bacterium]|nr:glycosyltransferase family 2 protein [Geobacteraceae bacterium]